jgi:predicted transcriptional regulator
VQQREAASGALRRLIKTFFNSDPSALVAHLVDAKQVSTEELDEMRRMLAKKAQR